MLSNSIKKLIFVLLLVLTIYIIFLVSPFILKILSFILWIIIPFIVSFAVAFVLQPVVVWLQRWVHRRSLAVLIVVIFFLIVIVMIGYTAIPYLLREIKVLIERLPTITSDLEAVVNNFAKKFDFLPDSYQPTFDNLHAFIDKNLTKISDIPGLIFSKLLRYFSIIVVIPMILIYFLLDYEKILCSFREYLVKKNKIHFKNYLGELNQTIASYVRGGFFIMFILTVASTGIFLIIGLDFAVFFALIIAITNVIPYLGPYIGAAFPVSYALIESPQKALTIALIIFIIQQIESNFLSPYIHSRRIKIHPLIVILTLLIFGALFGIIGMIFAVPVLAIIKITIKYYPPFKKKTV